VYGKEVEMKRAQALFSRPSWPPDRARAADLPVGRPASAPGAPAGGYP